MSVTPFSDFNLIAVSRSGLLAAFVTKYSFKKNKKKTTTHKQSGYRQSKPHFVLTITRGLPFMERGIRKTLAVAHFFFYSLALFFGVGQIVPPVGLIMLGLCGRYDNAS